MGDANDERSGRRAGCAAASHTLHACLASRCARAQPAHASARHDAERVGSERGVQRRRPWTAGGSWRGACGAQRRGSKRPRSAGHARSVTAVGARACRRSLAHVLGSERACRSVLRRGARSPLTRRRRLERSALSRATHKHKRAPLKSTSGRPPVAHRCPGCGEVGASPSPGCAARRPWTTRGRPPITARCRGDRSGTRHSPKREGCDL